MHTYFDKVSSFRSVLPLPIASLGIVLSLLVSHVNILLRISTPSQSILTKGKYHVNVFSWQIISSLKDN